MNGISSTGPASRPAVRNSAVASALGTAAGTPAGNGTAAGLYSSLHPAKAGPPASLTPPKPAAGAERIAPQAAPRSAGTPESSAWKTVASTAEHWGSDLSGLAHGGAQALGHAAEALADSATHAVQKAGSAVGSAVDAVGSGAKQAATYLAQGWNAARALVDEVT